MQKVRPWVLGVFLLGLIGAIGYGVYLVSSFLVIRIGALESEFAIATIVVCATLLVSVVTVAYNQRWMKVRDVNESHRPQKIDIYKKFMDNAIVGLLRANKQKRTSGKPFSKELQALYSDFAGDVIIWGSPEVIQAYREFRNCEEGENRIMLRLDDMLQEIRRDLGCSNSGLAPGDLVALLLTEPQHMQQII